MNSQAAARINTLYPAAEIALNGGMTRHSAVQPVNAANNTDANPLGNSTRFEDLLVRVGQSRDRDAFVRLFEHFAPRLKSFLIKGGLSPAQADDLAQDTMLTVWRKAPSYNPLLAGASTWIFTVARNRRIDYFRKIGRPEPDPHDPLMQGPAPLAPDTAINRSDESRVVAAALETLPPEQADLIRKVYFEEKSHSDIAAETALPIGTVKSRLRLGMDKLRRTLETDKS